MLKEETEENTFYPQVGSSFHIYHYSWEAGLEELWEYVPLSLCTCMSVEGTSTYTKYTGSLMMRELGKEQVNILLASPRMEQDKFLLEGN